ncbi:DUF2235 domain-containing protein [Pseudomonas sp. KFB-139]|uniref:DUF2235 domain-containing protein n=1 Tax=Pseudomonas serbiensis TaxID=3064350 RepID=A0ABT9CKP8_9PSED|nr:DUF2235 domain-containing protein [Pseudomonas sp. KFB-138]MDO7925990.1 DUF2235 domain-containing protein [Pseudomonas sp. KFB-138]
MEKGHFIGLGDQTTCGGRVLEGDHRLSMCGLARSRTGDRVTCGASGKTYRITGGIPWMHSQGLLLAGTFHSSSTCPCSARLIPSVLTATYGWPDAHARQAFRSVITPLYGFDASATQDRSSKDKPLEIEEEEEEVEQEQLITLRLGVFFDGTGNNQSNSESVAGCMARDVNLQDMAEEVRRFCAEHGYDGNGSSPDNSYGNDTSNIARLYDLYRDQADITIDSDAEEAALKVYIEGIGTISGGTDSLYSQGSGRGETGVLARVEQTQTLIFSSMRRLKEKNPNLKIRRIEVDIFGFSRGAAAARHFANNVLKGSQSLLAKALPTTMLIEDFAWRRQHDITLNFIGLFDTVAGIVSPLAGDFSPGNAHNPGLDLGLPTSAARKIVQFVARDEYRLNFALTRTGNDIVLPGSHSDIGGGYLPRTRERLLLSKPVSSLERLDTPDENSSAYRQTLRTTDPLLNRLIEQGIKFKPAIWSVRQPHSRDALYPEKRVYVAARIDREVDGDLSKVYLRVMRELGLRHQVPFQKLAETSSVALPAELLPVLKKIQAFVLGNGSALNLTRSEEAMLLHRYIHFSANWNAMKNWNSSDLDVVFINRPTDDYKRVVHANE